MTLCVSSQQYKIQACTPKNINEWIAKQNHFHNSNSHNESLVSKVT